jgi:hypothetical protein
VRDLIVTELEQVDGVHPWRAVVADEVFDHRQVNAWVIRRVWNAR